MSSVIMEGMLNKRGKKFVGMSIWRMRYFVLTENCLAWYDKSKKPAKDRPIGKFDLDEIACVNKVDTRHRFHPHRFTLHLTSGVVQEISASTQDECNRWVDALTKLVQNSEKKKKKDRKEWRNRQDKLRAAVMKDEHDHGQYQYQYQIDADHDEHGTRHHHDIMSGHRPDIHQELLDQVPLIHNNRDILNLPSKRKLAAARAAANRYHLASNTHSHSLSNSNNYTHSKNLSSGSLSSDSEYYPNAQSFFSEESDGGGSGYYYQSESFDSEDEELYEMYLREKAAQHSNPYSQSSSPSPSSSSPSYRSVSLSALFPRLPPCLIRDLKPVSFSDLRKILLYVSSFFALLLSILMWGTDISGGRTLNELHRLMASIERSSFSSIQAIHALPYILSSFFIVVAIEKFRRARSSSWSSSSSVAASPSSAVAKKPALKWPAIALTVAILCLWFNVAFSQTVFQHWLDVSIINVALAVWVL